jgi:hypothetical protein
MTARAWGRIGTHSAQTCARLVGTVPLRGVWGPVPTRGGGVGLAEEDMAG